MIAAPTINLAADMIAKALNKAVNNASRAWLGEVKALAYQTQPEQGAPAYASARVLRGVFTFRVVLKGNVRAALVVFHMDEKKLARAVLVMSYDYAESYARIMQGKGNKADCAILLQLASIGQLRFDPNA